MAAVTSPIPFIALAPCRIVDTRGNGAPIQGGMFTGGADVRNYAVAGICGIPAVAQALSLNFTVVGPTSPGFLVSIREIGAESDGLMKLRPVAFRYKPEIDPTGLTQYGLIAEDVADVYPDLVVYDSDGRPETVRYDLVNALLLSEVQKQHREIDELKARLAAISR
jgi:hypothetical protein